MKEKNAQLARRWFEEVWNKRRDETIDELTPAGLIGHHEMQTTRSRDDFKRFHSLILSLIPDVKVTVEDVLAGEDAVVVRWHFSGTNRQTSERVTFSGMTWLKVSDGQFVEGWDCWNPAPVLALQRSLQQAVGGKAT